MSDKISKDDEIINNIISCINGLSIAKSNAILDKVKRYLESCSIVDCSAPRQFSYPRRSLNQEL